MRLAVLAALLLALAPEARAQHCPAPLGKTNWFAVDAYALEAEPRDERDVATLARYLRRAGRSDAARIRAVYRWVADRIAYDVDALTGRRPSQRADSTLAARMGVCEGYARLSVALLAEMGIEARYVEGWGLPRSGTAAIAPDRLHAWVAARAGRKWILFDPTWAAGGIHRGRFQRRFDTRWFAPPADLFAQTHVPRSEAMQLLAAPLTLEDAVARKTPEPVCLRAPGASPTRHTAGARVAASGDGPPWRVQHGVRFRLLSAVPPDGLEAEAQAEIAIEVDGADAVAVFDGRVHLDDLRASGDVWQGRVRVGTQPLRIGVRTERGGRWRIVASILVR